VRKEVKVYKQYEVAKTPYERVKQSKKVFRETKQELQKTYESLNPAALTRSLQTKLRRIGKLLR